MQAAAGIRAPAEYLAAKPAGRRRRRATAQDASRCRSAPQRVGEVARRSATPARPRPQTTANPSGAVSAQAGARRARPAVPISTAPGGRSSMLLRHQPHRTWPSQRNARESVRLTESGVTTPHEWRRMPLGPPARALLGRRLSGGGAPAGTMFSTDRAFILFACEVASAFPLADSLREVPSVRSSRASTRLAEGTPVVALPYYTNLRRLGAVARAVLGTVRAFKRNLDRVDILWVFGPHPLGSVLVFLTLLREPPGSAGRAPEHRGVHAPADRRRGAGCRSSPR